MNIITTINGIQQITAANCTHNTLETDFLKRAIFIGTCGSEVVFVILGALEVYVAEACDKSSLKWYYDQIFTP